MSEPMNEPRTLSLRMNDLLREESKHDLSQMSQPDRVIHVVTLLQLYDTTVDVGWQEHTSDWDPVLLVNGEQLKNFDTPYVGGWSKDKTACVDYEELKHLIVPVTDDEGNDLPALYFAIDDLKTLALYHE